MCNSHEFVDMLLFLVWCKLSLNCCRYWDKRSCWQVNSRHYISAMRVESSVITTFGKIDEFDSACEDWPQYEEQLGHFFTANSIDNADKKRAVFLTIIGAATYKLLRTLVSPSKPGEMTYTDLVAALASHFNPTPSPIVQ